VKNRKTYDLVYLDVFDSYSIPSHLTTREFLESIKTVVEPDGFLLVNLIDVFSIGKFLAAFTATVEDVFSHYSVYTSTNFSPQTRSTFVVLAGEEDPGLGTLSHQGNEKRRETFTVINAERIAQLQERNDSIPLTDNHAPVENLIAPVFLQAIR
jgi:spermidine synthase